MPKILPEMQDASTKTHTDAISHYTYGGLEPTLRRFKAWINWGPRTPCLWRQANISFKPIYEANNISMNIISRTYQMPTPRIAGLSPKRVAFWKVTWKGNFNASTALETNAGRSVHAAPSWRGRKTGPFAHHKNPIYPTQNPGPMAAHHAHASSNGRVARRTALPIGTSDTICYPKIVAKYHWLKMIPGSLFGLLSIYICKISVPQYIIQQYLYNIFSVILAYDGFWHQHWRETIVDTVKTCVMHNS